ncbi:hypothetical protein [Mycolicibacterium goodii]|uniref:hypothetical protein n=1 Tax=Mycolicibacterium goodii TaxID=134601 RepID=UPI001055794B|nr:hypothetical protein [Mycolicibacterium goodii]
MTNDAVRGQAKVPGAPRTRSPAYTMMRSSGQPEFSPAEIAQLRPTGRRPSERESGNPAGARCGVDHHHQSAPTQWINDDVAVALAAPGQALNGVLGVAVADDAVSWGFGLRWV